MKTKPILFSTSMVQAINEGRKTQTRRVIKYKKEIQDPEIGFSVFSPDNHFSVRGIHKSGEYGESFFKLTIQKGDILWVRETFEKVLVQNAPVDSVVSEVVEKYIYKADGLESFIKWKPSIFMPKEACRLWLEVTDVRAEQLQDISEADAIAEGIEHYWNGLFQEERYKDYSKAKPGKFKPQRFYGQKGNSLGEWREANSSFFSLWESINGKASLNANPWVWVYTFKRCEMPKNFLS